MEGPSSTLLLLVGTVIALAMLAGIFWFVGDRSRWRRAPQAVWAWLKNHRRGLATTGQAAVFVAVVLFALFMAFEWPNWEVPAGVHTDKEPHVLIVNDVRHTGLLIAGGALALLTLWVAWRRSEAALRMAKANEQGQLTERFSRSIEQLGTVKGNSNDRNVEVRLGAIYALEQIARDDAEKYHWTVMEVLCAYVRANHRFDGYPTQEEEDEEPAKQEQDKQPPAMLEVQAALTVIGRRETKHDQGRQIDLRGTDLRGYNLARAHLEVAQLQDAYLQKASLWKAYLKRAELWRARAQEADFWGANLQEAQLEAARLHRATLHGAHLQKADLFAAHLQRANLEGAYLPGAYLPGAILVNGNLKGADLQGADLKWADLEGANLQRANLEGAILEGANLAGTNLEEVNLEGAYRRENDIPGWEADSEGRLHCVAAKPAPDDPA